MGIALISAKAKSFIIILFSWGIKGDSSLMTWLALSCNSQSYDDLWSALSQAPWGRRSLFVEAWKSSAEGVICESRLQQITHTVKFTKLANIITLKRSLIAQSQKLVTAYTRTQVRIVTFNFSANCDIKQNTAMNVNRSQKHGPIIKIMPCVEGDRSDCQPKASSSASGNGGCRGLTIWSVTLNMGHDCFYYTKIIFFTHLVNLSLYFRPICKTQRMSLYMAFPIILCLANSWQLFLPFGFYTAS